MTTQFRTWYMDTAIFNLQEVIETAKKQLAGIEFDTMVGTGFSGAIVIPSLALAMGKKFVLVRKENDDSHHGRGRLLGEFGTHWIFVDDFVSSGRTRARVIRKINEAADQLIEPGPMIRRNMVGQYTYTEYCGKTPEFKPYSADWAEADW